MELSLVTDVWDPQGGGRERYLGEYAAWALSQGDRIHVHCFRDQSESRPPAPTSLSTTGGRGPRAERILQHDLSTIRTSSPDRPVLSARPQIGATHYQLHSGIYREAFAAERESLESAVRRLLYWPALRLNRHRRAQLEAERRLFEPHSNIRLMTFSAAGAEKLQSTYSIAEDRICVSHPGVDLERFDPAAVHEAPASQENRLLLLFAGHNFVLKGLKTAILTVARCRKIGIDASLKVAGAGPIARFRRVSEKQGIADHVHFLGAIDQESLAAQYLRSHILIHPTFYDPFPRVVIEALVSGCVAVTTRRCGAAEIIIDGVNGATVERPDDVNSFVAACTSLSNRSTWAEARRAGLELRNTFSFGDHARTVRDWLER